MWNFIDGVKNPAKKRKLDEVAKRERDKYDNESRKRAFHEPWKVNRDWLVYDVDKVAMFCTICSTYATTKNDRLCSFIGGCKNFHTASIADFDPTAAIHLWNSSGTRARRPEFVEFENSKDTDSDMSEDAFSDVAEL